MGAAALLDKRARSIPAAVRPHPLLRRLADEFLDPRLQVRGRDADVGVAVGGAGTSTVLKPIVKRTPGRRRTRPT